MQAFREYIFTNDGRYVLKTLCVSITFHITSEYVKNYDIHWDEEKKKAVIEHENEYFHISLSILDDIIHHIGIESSIMDITHSENEIFDVDDILYENVKDIARTELVIYANEDVYLKSN